MGRDDANSLAPILPLASLAQPSAPRLNPGVSLGIAHNMEDKAARPIVQHDAAGYTNVVEVADDVIVSFEKWFSSETMQLDKIRGGHVSEASNILPAGQAVPVLNGNLKPV